MNILSALLTDFSHTPSSEAGYEWVRSSYGLLRTSARHGIGSESCLIQDLLPYSRERTLTLKGELTTNALHIRMTGRWMALEVVYPHVP